MTNAVVIFEDAPLAPSDKQMLFCRLPSVICRHIAAAPAHSRRGSLLAYTALSLILPPDRLADIRFSDGKKPCFSDRVGDFSLSHTNGAVAAAVSDGTVGIDVQCLTAPRPGVIRRCFSEGEQHLLQHVAQTGQTYLFTRLWTQKEAAVKRTGRGLAGLSDPVDPYAVFSFVEEEGFIACVCADEATDISVLPLNGLWPLLRQKSIE